MLLCAVIAKMIIMMYLGVSPRNRCMHAGKICMTALYLLQLLSELYSAHQLLCVFDAPKQKPHDGSHHITKSFPLKINAPAFVSKKFVSSALFIFQIGKCFNKLVHACAMGHTRRCPKALQCSA